MAALVGIRGQASSDRLYDASGTITTGGTPQLILPWATTRSSLIIENISATNMYFEFGAARATATVTNGSVTSCTVTNAGFGYSVAPSISFLGGANLNRNSQPPYTLQGLPDWPSPSSSASAHCVMSGSAPNMTIASIVVDSGGSGYAYPPTVYLQNRHIDPFGCAVPSATSGILLLANGGSYTPNGSVCTTDQISVYCSASNSAYTVKFTL